MRGFGLPAAGSGIRRGGYLEGGRLVEWFIAPAAILVVALVIAAVVRTFVRVTVVHEHERGLRYRGGRLAGLTQSGAHVTVRPFSEIQVLDVRPAIVPVDGQEILTADGVVAKISLAARYVVGDAVAAVTRDADFRRTLYLLLQLALRDAITARTLEEVLAARRQLGPEVRDACAARLGEIGLELLEVEVRDVMLPAELKRAYAGTVAARKDGEAALERARAETASLRSLANAGHMLDENPGLLQLRILERLGESSGATVIYGVPEGAVALRPAPSSAPSSASASAAPSSASSAPAPTGSPRARGRRSGGIDPVS
jgi:regulator of protease activity HflC (stomatin/prohibitin superfamily)